MITHIDQDFDFLGFNVCKYDGKLLIKPSKKGVKTFLDGLRTIIKSNPTIKEGEIFLPSSVQNLAFSFQD